MSSEPASSYEALKQRFAEISRIQGAAAILRNDQEITMPAGSAEDRTGQLVVLAAQGHRLLIAPEVGQWLDEAERDQEALSSADRRNLALMRKTWVVSSAFPEDLVRRISHMRSEGNRLHLKWRSTGNWDEMKDWYAHTFEIAREMGRIRQQQLGLSSPYEALLDIFSPEMSEEMITAQLAKVEAVLPELIAEANRRKESEPAPIPLSGSFPLEKQRELVRRVVGALGFDFERGRIDMGDVHPSCGGTADDNRLTADFNENDFTAALFSAIHEAGHGIYEQNTPKEWRHQPAGVDLGMAVHESQSRIMEIQACGLPEFFSYLEAQAREIFARPDDPALAAENLQRLRQTTQPSFIRIFANEITYPAHIILRHRIERAMVNGEMSIDELPQAWNEGMHKLLGITPPDPAKGHMQDVHWPCGLIGYFPAYTLGDMGAAQLFTAACRAHKDIPAEIGKGNFAPLKSWLGQNVHGKGSLLTPDELYIKATGEKLNARCYLNHLSARYLGRPIEQAA